MFFSNKVTEKRIIHYWPDIEKKKIVYAEYIDSASVSTTTCDHAYETTDHFQFECPNLKYLMQELLHSMPDIDNILYGDVSQLINTSKYYFMAQRRRAKTHNYSG